MKDTRSFPGQNSSVVIHNSPGSLNMYAESNSTIGNDTWFTYIKLDLR
jgi:hypothetical protein